MPPSRPEIPLHPMWWVPKEPITAQAGLILAAKFVFLIQRRESLPSYENNLAHLTSQVASMFLLEAQSTSRGASFSSSALADDSS